MTHWQSMRLVILPQAFRGPVTLANRGGGTEEVGEAQYIHQRGILEQDDPLGLSLADFFRTASTIGERDGTQVEMILFAGGVYFVTWRRYGRSRRGSIHTPARYPGTGRSPGLTAAAPWIQSISRGQSSAALALGMTHWQSMRLVILPQAFRAGRGRCSGYRRG
jgi:hypothetical protein